MHFPLTVEIRTVLVSPVSPGGEPYSCITVATVCTAGVRTVCYGRIARGGFTALHQTAALCKSGLGMWRKTAPINAFLICCTGITPYNVIIHPDPGFVKYFLKFQHNNPAIYGTLPELPPDSSMNASYYAWEQQNIFDFNRNPVFP